MQDDKRFALQMLAACSEDRLAHDKAPAPWDPTELLLGHRLLQVVDHLKQHKGQLFYYLKLQGKSVNTGTQSIVDTPSKTIQRTNRLVDEHLERWVTRERR